MIEEAAALLRLTEPMFWHGVAVFLRIGAFIGMMPGFGEATVPVRVRLALAFALTLPVAAVLPPLVTAPDPAVMARLLLSETVAGLALGLSLRFFVHALQIAGSIAAQATSLAQIFATAGGDPQPAVAHVLVLAGLALAMITGLHVKVIALLVESYSLFPPGEMPGAGLLASWGTAQVGAAFSLGFSLAAPFVIVSVLYNLTLGAINRAMPQMMVVFVGAPVISFGALALLMLLAPPMLQVWLGALDAHVADPTGGSR